MPQVINEITPKSGITLFKSTKVFHFLFQTTFLIEYSIIFILFYFYSFSAIPTLKLFFLNLLFGCINPTWAPIEPDNPWETLQYCCLNTNYESQNFSNQSFLEGKIMDPYVKKNKKNNMLYYSLLFPLREN